jgi:hypothetical protein
MKSMNPYPVHDPRHNLNEIAKECHLLERHLMDPSKFCRDCIKKHFLAIAGLAGPELVSLDTEQEYQNQIGMVGEKIPHLTDVWAQSETAIFGEDGKRQPHPQELDQLKTLRKDIGQELREVRKVLLMVCFHPSFVNAHEAVRCHG